MNALLTVLSGLGVAVVTATATIISTRFTARQTRSAAADQLRLERDKAEAAKERSIWDAMNSIAEQLRKDLADSRARVEALSGRVDALERERDAHKAAIRALTAYTRQLMRMLRTAGITPPDPPDGFNEHTLP